MTIRPARLADADAIVEVLRSGGPSPASVESELQACLASQSHSVLVAVDAEATLQGYLVVHWLPYLMLSAPEAFISELFVHKESRGQGIGTALLDAAQSEAQRRGCSRMHMVNFRSRESYTRGFYAKAGWHERLDAADFIRNFSE